MGSVRSYRMGGMVIAKNKKNIRWHFISLILAGCSTQHAPEDGFDSLITITEPPSTVVAIVNGEEILTDEIQLIQQSFASSGQQISLAEATEQAVIIALLSQQAISEGHFVNDSEAETIIDIQLTLQGSSLDDYKGQLASQGIAYEEQLDDIKKELAIQNYLSEFLEGKNYSATPEEAKEFYDDYMMQSPEDAPPYPDIEQQILSYLEQVNQQQEINAHIEELREKAVIDYF